MKYLNMMEYLIVLGFFYFLSYDITNHGMTF